MACTRFFYDPCRTKKQLQQATGPGRYILDVPGNGSQPCYIEDPQIIIQKWGANLRTNTINLESDLMGVNKPLSRDCLGKDNYQTFAVSNNEIQYPSNSNAFTDQSRTTHPAWWYRDVDRVNLEYPFLNPQENTCLPFQNNLSTRVLEKDYFTPKRDCVINETNNYLPSSFNLIKGNYIGGPNTCASTKSCEPIKSMKSTK
jgi:hypothetical protein